MRIVKIIAGIYGYRENGRVVPKTRQSKPFPLDDFEAERLVSIGVAEIIDGAVATADSESKQHKQGACTRKAKSASEAEYKGKPVLSALNPD